MFICGSGSFVYQEDTSPCTTPRKSKRVTSLCKIIGKDNSNKNPYEEHGLEKFNALLAHHDDKKQKIYTTKGSQDISFVRFVYTNDSKHAKTIIVRVKGKNKQEKTAFTKQSKNRTKVVQGVAGDGTQICHEESEALKLGDGNNKRRCLRCDKRFRLHNLRQPHYYFPMIMVIILFSLAIFGRSFGILCTLIVWYLFPDVIGERSSVSVMTTSSKRKLKNEKQYARKLSEIRSVHNNEGPSSPTSVLVKWS